MAQFQKAGGLMPNTAGKTVRGSLKNGVSGTGFRIVLGEQYGAKEVRYEGAVEVRGRLSPLSFDGNPRAALKPGEAAASDPIGQSIEAGDTVNLWLYSGDSPESVCMAGAVHSAAGNFCGQDFAPEPFAPPAGMPEAPEVLCGYRRLEVEISAEERPPVAAVFGDSIAAMGYWTGPLGEKFAAAPGRGCLCNLGISGNRLLRNTAIPFLGDLQIFGQSGLSRLQGDVLDAPGIRTLLLALGINDISQPGGVEGMSPDKSEICSTGELIDGCRRVISRCRGAGIQTLGCTITPFGGYATYNDRTALIWREANRWIRESGEFDAVIDFASALADPQKPDYLAAQYDSGDHLHPNEAGGAAMAAAVPIPLLSGLR
jgi:lysophospholipase L1-like esterase